MLKTTCEAAAVEALRAYLEENIRQTYPDILVSGEWPAADQPLPERSITVIIAGDVNKVYFDPYVLDASETVDQQKRIVWAMGSYEVPIQVDVWCLSKAERADLLERVRELSVRGRSLTMGNRFADPVGISVLLPLASDGGFCDYLFDAPSYHDGPEAIQRDEWRASMQVQAVATETKTSVSPVVNKITVKFNFRDQGTPPWGDPYDRTITLTSPSSIATEAGPLLTTETTGSDLTTET